MARMKPEPVLGGFWQRRICVVPTWRGWALLILIGAIAVMVVVRGAYDFLSPNDSTPGGLLVLEGWQPDYVLQEAAEEFQRHHYKGIVVTGDPIEKGAPLSDYGDHATLSVAVLARMGVKPDLMHVALWPRVPRDRTYASAAALRAWLYDHGLLEETINLFSCGPHARRSRLLYQRTLGTKVGVIAIKDRAFDPARWWASSSGFRSVTDEMIAYIYARFVFEAWKL